MAKRKRAAALFEVIHADKRFPTRHPSGSIAGWWTKRPAGSSAEPEISAPRGPSLLSRLFSHMPDVPRIGLQVDPETQQVHFRLSYTAALVAAFTIVVAFALAFAIGRSGSHKTVPALAEQTTEELRAGPAQPDVLDVGTDSAPLAMAAEPTPAPQRRPTTASVASAQGMRPSQWSEPKVPATLMVFDSKRTVGLQYVVIQAYPPEEEKYAKAAADLLNSNGILCTMEKGIPYSPRWICIVGVTGFGRVRNSPEYDAYIAKIEQIGAQSGGTSKFLKKLDPKPYKWRDAKNAS